MRFAEIFLRLGCSLVGWMLLYTYIVWLAALHAMGCGPDGDAMHRLLLGLAPFTAAMSLLLRLTRPMPEIHRIVARLACHDQPSVDVENRTHLGFVESDSRLALGPTGGKFVHFLCL